jgi:trans-2,3-dihydro-3-hydroxyanthranilate isomerase
MRLRYLHLDVFTDRKLEGNQLAVFPEPGDVPAALMQRIAAEMAFSESTFIFPAERGGDVRMRIFTPAEELPMAGHPTIGSTFALVIDGVIARGRKDFVFELGVGPTPVSLDWNGGDLGFAWMTQRPPEFRGRVSDRAAVAGALGISQSDLVADLPLEVVWCGLPYFLVPIASRAAVDSVAIDRKSLKAAYAGAGLDELPVYAFTTERGTGDEIVYSRMLAPGFGIAEDPATGSACGPLGSYLVHHGVVSGNAAHDILNLQGAAMGRPSRLHTSIDSDGGTITRVRVGGTSVLVGRGELEL